VVASTVGLGLSAISFFSLFIFIFGVIKRNFSGAFALVNAAENH
jgi:hypothetical protein